MLVIVFLNIQDMCTVLGFIKKNPYESRIHDRAALFDYMTLCMHLIQRPVCSLIQDSGSRWSRLCYRYRRDDAEVEGRWTCENLGAVDTHTPLVSRLVECSRRSRHLNPPRSLDHGFFSRNQNGYTNLSLASFTRLEQTHTLAPQRSFTLPFGQTKLSSSCSQC